MKNVLIYNKVGEKTRHSDDLLDRYLKAQVHNSLDLGWKPEDIIIGTNFDFEHMGVKNVKLIESDKRKAVFLREVSRLFDLSTAVFDERIETLPPMKPRIIVSRALGTIDNILYLSKKQITVKTEVIQFVGENESKEIGKQKLNKFNIKSTSCKTYQSITREKSKIVVYSF